MCEKLLITLVLASALLVSFSCARRQSIAPSTSQSAASSPEPNAALPPSSLGWDLTYVSLLGRNGIGPDSDLWRWGQHNRRPPVNNFITGWQDEPIVSSALIELPGPEGDQESLVRANGESPLLLALYERAA